MTQGEFRARLAALGLKPRGFATLTGLHYQTVIGWGRPRHDRAVQEFPLWVDLLLTAWAWPAWDQASQQHPSTATPP